MAARNYLRCLLIGAFILGLYASPISKESEEGPVDRTKLLPKPQPNEELKEESAIEEKGPSEENEKNFKLPSKDFQGKPIDKKKKYFFYPGVGVVPVAVGYPVGWGGYYGHPYGGWYGHGYYGHGWGGYYWG